MAANLWPPARGQRFGVSGKSLALSPQSKRPRPQHNCGKPRCKQPRGQPRLRFQRQRSKRGRRLAWRRRRKPRRSVGVGCSSRFFRLFVSLRGFPSAGINRNQLPAACKTFLQKSFGPDFAGETARATKSPQPGKPNPRKPRAPPTKSPPTKATKEGNRREGESPTLQSKGEGQGKGKTLPQSGKVGWQG